MVSIGKALRWFFAIHATLFVAISVRFLFACPSILWKVWHSNDPGLQRLMGFPTAAVMVIAGTVTYSTIAFILGRAWWTLGKGEKSAQGWALAASVALIPMLLFGSTAMISTVAGTLGLVVFRVRKTVEAIGPQREAAGRTAGDGTNRMLDSLAIALMYGGVILGALMWDQWALKQGLPSNPSLLMNTLVMQIAALIATGVHELGHALAALTQKMKIRQFLWGPLEWRLRGNEWEFRFHVAGLLSVPGAVGVAPMSLDGLRRRRIKVCAAGPMASLALGAIGMWATLAAKGHPWEAQWELLAYVSTFSLLQCVINFLPIQPEGNYSDGARIYQLAARTPGSQLELAFAMVSSTVVSPLRPKDMDIGMIERAAAYRKTGAEALLLRLNACTHFLDSGRMPEALRALSEAEAVYTESEPELPGDLRVLAQEAFTYANAVVRRDAGAARGWWDRTKKVVVLNADHLSADHFTADQWKAYCSLLWIENRLEEARAAWERGNDIAKNSPQAGAYEYGRDCFARLRVELDAVAA
jgi:Peptidase family M50